MGCIATQVRNCNAEINTIILGLNGMEADFECQNGIEVNIGSANAEGWSAFTNVNTRMETSFALVCQISLGRYEYFYVQDEPLMVQDGYLMVKKG